MRINEYVPDSSIFNKISDGKAKNNNVETGGFGALLKGKLDEVNEKQITAENTTKEFVEGGKTEIHKVMLDTEEAKMSLELAVQIRNKFVEAYQELSRTQL